MLLGGAGLLALTFAGYLKSHSSADEFWQFNLSSWTSAAIGLLAAVVSASGLSAFYGALEVLFNVNVDDDVYVDTWLFCFSIIGPWMALTGIPQLSQRLAISIPWVVRVLSTYFLVPLVIAYFGLIYAYIIKIAIDGALPNGYVATLISVYASLGVVTHLIVRPLAAEGPALLRLFDRYFFPALIVPLVLLVWATKIRIDAYGFTETRLILIVFAIWLITITALYTIRRKSNPRWMPIPLAVLLVLSTVGPWNFFSLSQNSQLARLENIFEQSGTLANGVIKPIDIAADDPANREVTSIVQYLLTTDKQEALLAFLAERDFRPEDPDPYTDSLVTALGYKTLYRYSNVPSFNYGTPVQLIQAEITGFDYISSLRFYGSESHTLRVGPDGIGLTASYDDETGLLSLNQDETVPALTFNVAAYVDSVSVQDPVGHLISNTLTKSSETMRAELRFSWISGIIEEDQRDIQSFEAILLIEDLEPEPPGL